MRINQDGPSLLPVPAAGLGLIVRPDWLVWTFALQTSRADAASTLKALRAAHEDLVRRVKVVAPAAVVRVRDFAAEPTRTLKPKVTENESGLAGHIELALAEKLSFWERAASVAAVQDMLSSLTEEWRQLKPPVTSRIGQLQALVNDPEQHRPALLQQWMARVRDLANAAQSSVEAAAILDLQVPEPVAQKEISLEEVLLTIKETGRIGLPFRDATPRIADPKSRPS